MSVFGEGGNWIGGRGPAEPQVAQLGVGSFCPTLRGPALQVAWLVLPLLVGNKALLYRDVYLVPPYCM